MRAGWRYHSDAGDTGRHLERLRLHRPGQRSKGGVKGHHRVFYESTCEISNPQNLRGLDNTILFDATCQGEGESWTARFILMQTADGGLAMMNKAWGDHYARYT